MSLVISSQELAQKLFLSHNQLKTLVKENGIAHRADRKGGYILAAEAEALIVSKMLSTTEERNLSRIRAAAGKKGAATRKKNRDEPAATETSSPPKKKTTTQA